MAVDSNAVSTPSDSIARADEELLAALGYKQEFKRAFSPLEVRSYSLKAMLKLNILCT